MGFLLSIVFLGLLGIGVEWIAVWQKDGEQRQRGFEVEQNGKSNH